MGKVVSFGSLSWLRAEHPHAEHDRCFECGRLDGLSASARIDAGRLAEALTRVASLWTPELIEHLRSLAKGEGP